MPAIHKKDMLTCCEISMLCYSNAWVRLGFFCGVECVNDNNNKNFKGMHIMLVSSRNPNKLQTNSSVAG